MQKLKYGYQVQLGVPPLLARQLVAEALAREGFGILTEIDVSRTLADRIGVEVPPYTILGACNPALAHAALEADQEIGLLLPCNVVIREEAGGATVAIMDPLIMSQMSGAADLEEIAQLAHDKIVRVMNDIEDENAR